MEISVKEQLVCSLASIIYGYIVSCGYDILSIAYMILGINKISRNLLTKGMRLILNFVIDFAFCIVACLGYTVLLYEFFYGRPRLAFIVCACIGFLLYRVTLSKAVLWLSGIVLEFIRKLTLKVLKILLLPIVIPLKYVCGRTWDFIRSSIVALIVGRKKRRDIKYVNKIISDKLSDVIRI